jgi:hypothetical protein
MVAAAVGIVRSKSRGAEVHETPQGAKQAAETGIESVQMHEKRTAGAKQAAEKGV